MIDISLFFSVGVGGVVVVFVFFIVFFCVSFWYCCVSYNLLFVVMLVWIVLM